MPLQDRIMELLAADEVQNPSDVLRALHLVIEKRDLDLRAALSHKSALLEAAEKVIEENRSVSRCGCSCGWCKAARYMEAQRALSAPSSDSDVG